MYIYIYFSFIPFYQFTICKSTYHKVLLCHPLNHGSANCKSHNPRRKGQATLTVSYTFQTSIFDCRIYETSKGYTKMSYQRRIMSCFVVRSSTIFLLEDCFGSAMILSSSPHVSNPMLFEYSSWLLMQVKFRKWTKAYSKTNAKRTLPRRISFLSPK